ncbi:uncharacterized protein LOC142505427 [Primulina tabacum]|uniref:uncharacterized protein LOC142505427 n=1 Tax=Primulina tabacum TaxID=48773 RepID=UPI003F5AD25A
MRRILLSLWFGGSFARVCIELDVLQPLQEKIWVGWGDHFQVVEVIYERVPHFCCNCKMLGHSLDFCTRNGQTFQSRRRGPQRQAAHAPPSSDQQNQRPRPHGKGIVSDSPIQAPSVPSQGVSSDQAPSSDSDVPEQVVKRPCRRPVVRKDPNRPISTKNYYEVLQDLPSESGPGETSGTVKPRTHRVKSLLSKLTVEGNAEAGYPFRPASARSSSSQTTATVDVVNSSVTAVPAPVDVPVQVVELVPVVQDTVMGTPVSSPLPSLEFDSASVGSMTGVVPSSTTECLSLPLPGRTRSQQRRYYRQKAAQASSPYRRPLDPG